MLLEEIKNANGLIQYLREFRLWQTQVGPYDQTLILYLLLSILDNLHESEFEPELDNVGYLFNDSQRSFIKAISDVANSITDEQVEAILALEEQEEEKKI